MKKCKSKTKKKLPRYVLGTMKPIDLGYLPGRGIGTTFRTEENISLDPETRALRSSIVPNAINTISQYGTQVANNLKEGPVFGGGTKSSPSMATTAANATQTMNKLGFNSVPLWQIKAGINPSGITSSLTGTTINTATPFASELGTEIGSSLGSNLSSKGLAGLGETSADTFFGTAAKEGAKSGGKWLGSAANVGGRALSVLGAAKGLYDMGSLIANESDHRTASDMLTNVGRNYTTSEYGNTSMNYNGINKAQELAYENASRKAKQTNFFLTSTGTGASIGSLFPGFGTAIGAGIGALIGGLGNLLGFGDNEEEVRREIMLAQDNITGFNRQQDAVRKSKDMAAEFNDRMGYAKCGKSSGGPMKYKNGKNDFGILQGPNGLAVGEPTSLLAPGEYTYDPVNMTGDKVTGKGHEDTIPSYIEPNDLNIVFSDSLKLGNTTIAKHAAPMIKEIEKLNKIITNVSQAEGIQEGQQQLQISQAKQRQQLLNEQLMQLSELQNIKREEKEMGRYKCGKLPKFGLGTDYMISALPHIASMISSYNAYDRAKKADTYAPSTYVPNKAGMRAVNELAQLRFDPSQYLNDALRAYNQANWQVGRNAGYGAGSQAIMRNANLQSYLASLGNIRAKEQEANNSYRAAYADALAKYGAAEQEAMIRDNVQRFNWKQQQNAAKEYYLDTYRKNRLIAAADLAHDVMGVRQFGRSMDYQNKALKIYGDNESAKNAATMQQIYNQAEANRLAREQLVAQSKLTASYTNPQFIQGSWRNPIYQSVGIPEEAWKIKTFKCGKPGYETGKGVIRRDKTVSGREESVSPQNLLGIGDWSTKLITNAGDTIYRDPTAANVFFSNPTQVMRSKGGEATPEYLKAKARHEQLLNNAIASEDITPWQMIKGLFGFKCGKPAYKCGKSSKRKRC